jgi:hypothetical protein
MGVMAMVNAKFGRISDLKGCLGDKIILSFLPCHATPYSFVKDEQGRN